MCEMKIQIKTILVIHLSVLMSHLCIFVQTNDDFDYDSTEPQLDCQMKGQSYHPKAQNNRKLMARNYMSKNTIKKSPKQSPKHPPKRRSQDSKTANNPNLKREALLLEQSVGMNPRFPAFLFGNVSVLSSDLKLSAPECGIISKNFIVGGEGADQGSQPWIASVIKKDRHYCGATIINHKWLISAAHAFPDEDPKLYTIRVGNIDRELGYDYSVQKIVVHNRYNINGFKTADIALVKIRGEFEWSANIRPICLPADPYQEVNSSSIQVSGWGYLKYQGGVAPQMLQTVKLNVFPPNKCAQIYQTIDYKIFRSQICTLNDGQDACQGDSGGPAIETVNGLETLVGIVSFGVKCAEKFPGLFTKVSYFLNWIQYALHNEDSD